MPKRILEGNVVSNKTDKTVTVRVERRFLHPVYKKYIKHSSRFAAHDEANLCEVDELVQIQECKPLSKRKRWQVISGKAGEANKDLFANDVEAKPQAGKNKSGSKDEFAKKPAAKKAPKTAAKSADSKAKKTEPKKTTAKGAAKKTATNKTVAKKETGKKKTESKSGTKKSNKKES